MTRRLVLPDSGGTGASGDGRRSAPSAERNAAPILEVLRRIAPRRGRALEIASGTGQHAATFAAALPGLEWQPSDADPAALDSIAAWVAHAGLPNLHMPVAIDAARPGWGARHAGHDFVIVVNLLHLISGVEARAVVAGIAEALAPGGTAAIYGPFRRDGALTSDGDRAFDASLRAQDPAIGYKEVAEVESWASDAGLAPVERVEMPANNLMLVFRRPA